MKFENGFTEKQYKHDQKYIKDHITFVNVPFNDKKPEDMEMLAWLESQGKRKRSAYIKQLIREDMEKGG